MRKRIGILFIVFVLALTAGFAVACSEVKAPDNKEKTYTVTYYYNYDGAPNNGVYRTDSVDANTAAKKPTNPTRANYTFTDWTVDAAGNVSYNFSTLVVADLKLYAQWQDNNIVSPTLTEIDASVTKQYKVGDTFNKSDITVTAKYSDGSERAVTDFTYTPNPDMSTAGQKTITVSYGGKTKAVNFTVASAARALDYINIVPPTKRIYTVGEELDLTGLAITAVYTDESEENLEIADCEVTGYNKDVLGDQTVTVTYGGKFKTFAVTVAYLERVQIITYPDKTDYDVGDRLDLTGIVVTADYANDQTIIHTEYLTEGDFDVSGFDSSEKGDQTVTISYKNFEDSFIVTVTQAERTVSFVTGVVGIENPAAQTVDKYAKITQPDGDFERVGYTFDGWFKDDEDQAYDFDSEVTEYFTLTAKWTAIEYDINYVIENDEDGNPYATAPEKVTYTIEDVVDLLDPTDIKEGYTFIGWYDEVGEDEDGNAVYDNAHKVTGIELGSTGEKTFYARIAAIKTFTVTFNYNYDETPITKTANVQEGTVATALNPAPTRTGYNFDGWFTDVDCTDTWDFDVDTVTYDVTLYAKWNIAVYTVTFDADNGEEEHQTQQVEYNKPATKPANPVKDLHGFNGWTLYGSPFDFNTPITGDITLVASWTYNVQQGKFMRVRANDNSPWEDKYNPVGHNEDSDDSEWKVADVKLQVGTEFLVVEHGDGWDNWYNAQDGFTQWNANDVITVVYNDGNFKVTKMASGYDKLTWTLYIKKSGWGISLVPRNANEKRSPAVNGTVNWAFSEDRPNDKIFIAGTFTDGFKYHQSWSTESKAVTVLESWGTYTFRHVYLKKNDAFKIVNNGNWLSGNFEALDQEFWIHGDYSEDIALTSINNGWYDIVYNTYDSTLRIKKYTEATLTGLEVELRNPDKIFKVGDTVVKNDLYVRTVNSDGVRALISGYTINAPDMSTPGEKWFSVSYSGLEGWVKIDVRNTKTGSYLYILTDIAADKWEEKYTAVWQDGDYGAEWKVTGVKLQVGTKFLVVDYKQDGTDWYHSSSEYFAHNYDNIITIVGNGDNYEVTRIDSAYLNVSWTMTIKLDGTYVYLELPQNGVENRTPDGNGKLTFGDGVGDKIYIAGNFTDDFKYHVDWSTESTKMTVLSSDGIYVFRGVYLKQGDRFKIVNNGSWLGGNFTAVGTQFDIGDGDNIMLFALTTGKYDLVYDSVNNKLTIKAYAAITLSGIEITPPARTEYTVGDNLDTAGLTVKAVYTNGYKSDVALSACSITGYNKAQTGTQTVTVTYQGKTKTFTVTVNEPQSSYTVTFDSKGGSAVEAQEVDYNGTVTQPADPTRYGYIFDGWFKDENYTVAWNFDSDKITSTTTIYAKWTEDESVGYYLHILTQTDPETWEDVDAAINPENNGEVIVDGVHLAVGVKFLAYKGGDWYHASADGFTQYGGCDDIITIGVDGDNYIVTAINPAYADAVWKLYIKKEGYANSISIELSKNADESRATDGEGTLTFGTRPDDKIFIAGNFTGGFLYHKDWSTESTAVTVLNNNGVYTFRGVYLKKNDAFKIVDNGNWKGGNFVAVGTQLNLNSDRNITLAALTDGLYDIVYDSVGGKLTIKAYVPAEIASIAVKTEPTKTNYFKGEDFDAEGLVVTATDTEGLTKTITDYTLSGNTTDTTGTVTVTVTCGTLTATFDIEVSMINVMFMDGETELSALTVTSEYNQKLTAPEDLTKEGYTFDGWFKDAACTDAWNFDTDKVTDDITLYAGWTEEQPERTLTGITAELADATKTYMVGDAFNKTDIIVTAHYSDDTTETVDDFTFTAPDMTTAGEKTITVTYGEEEETVTITVNAAQPVRTLTSITATLKNASKQYKVNDTFDKTDIVVTGNYSDNTTEEISEFEIGAVDMTTAGEKTIAVTASGMETTVTILVKNKLIGTFLHVLTDIENDKWSDMYTPVELNGDGGKEWQIDRVSLQVGTKFLVVTYGEDGNTWYHASGYGFTQYGDSNDVIEIGVDGDNYIVNTINSAFVDAVWELRLKQYDNANSIYVALSKNADESRTPDGEGTLEFTARPTDKIFIAGNFTGGFMYNQAWSTESTAIKVLEKDGVYTFRGVYLKKNDAFKIVNGTTWLGGDFSAVGEEINLNGSRNITLITLTTGKYDVVYDSVNAKLTVVAYAPAATDSIEITTEPTKTAYDLGEAFDATGLVVTATDTDGESKVVTGYTLSGNSTAAAGTITVTVTYDDKTATFTVTVNPFTVTYNANGGTLTGDETATVSVVNGKLTAPTEPTKEGYTFGGWFADEELTDEWAFGDDGDPVTGNITLYAKWTEVGKTGTFLHVLTSVDPEKWEDLYTPVEFDGGYGMEWKVEGVKLQVGTQFLVVRYDDNTWYNANGTISQYGFNDVLTIEAEGGNYKVTSLNTAYADLAWTLRIKQDGSGVTVELPLNGTEYRAPNGVGTLEFGDNPSDKIFIVGNFTGGFNYNQAWSTENTDIVTDAAGVYTFHGVYLKQCDRFKIMNNGAWLGGNFTAVGTEFGIADGGSDVTLYALATGKYDIVYDSVNSTLTINAYVPTATLTSIAVTKQPTKTTYFKGEAFDATGLEVTATYSDDSTEVVENYTLSGNSTAATGTITVTVTYDGETATFTITVTQITVTFKDGDTVLDTADVDYNGKVTKPADPTKEGYKFDGWYADNACTDAWDFDTETVTADATIYAKWIKLYTVTFDTNGGSEVEAIENVEHGSTITAPTAPTKDGFTFAGWTLDGSAFDFDTPITDDITLVATWEGDVGTFLRYTVNGTDWIYGYKAEREGTENKLLIRGVKIYNNMEFVVVTKNAEGNSIWLNAGLSAPFKFSDDAITVSNVNGNFKITLADESYSGSGWTIYLYDLTDGVTVGEDGALDKNTYACGISLEARNGDENRGPDGTVGALTFDNVPDGAIYVAGTFTLWKGDKAWSTASDDITVLSKDGVYTFRGVQLKKNDAFKIVNNGWWGGNFTAVGAEIELSDDYAPDLVLASLTDDKYDIIYNSNANTLKIVAFAEATTASIAVTAQPTKTTYYKGEAFDATGLEITATDTLGFSEIVTGYALTNNNTDTAGTITVTVTYDGKTATFTIEVTQITVTFKDGDTVLSELTANVDYNGTISAPTAPTKEGYAFGGWTLDGSAYTFGTPITAPITLDATWNVNSYDLTYVYGNGTADSTSQVEYGTSITLTAPVKAGSTFGGWFDGTTTYNAGDIFVMPAKAVTLTAQWDVERYTLTYVYGNGTDNSSSTVAYGANVTLAAAPSKTGYTFGGWNDGTTTHNAGASYAMPANDVTLTAVWNVITYTINYSVGGGTNGANVGTYKITDADFTLVNATAPATYYFVEWQDKNGDAVTKLDSSLIALADNTNTITLTAVYDNKYTVTFDANGGVLDETTTAQKVAYGSTVTKPEDPTRNSYDFKGWYTTAACTTEWNFATDTVTGNVTIYAGWRQNPKDGTFLYGTMTGWDEDFAQYKAEEWDWGNEWKISGVTLTDGDEFVFTSYDEEGNNSGWINPAYNFAQNSHTDIFTVSNENSNFKITFKAGKEAYAKAVWTIFVKKDGSGISFAISGGADTNRKPDGTTAAAFTETGAADVYIVGNFTNGFKQNDDWSSNSTVIDTAKSGNKYYFANVKLMRNDALKIKMGDAWLGLNGDDKLTVTADFAYESSSDGNIVVMAEGGFYDVVFDSANKTLSITAHKQIALSVKDGAQIFVGTTPDESKFNVMVDGAAAADFTVIAQPAVAGSNTVTVICGNTVAKATYTTNAVEAISGIAVKTNPTDAVYDLGDTFSPTGLVLTVSYNTGKTVDVAYDNNMTFTSAALNASKVFITAGNTVAITVTYSGKTATFNVKVNPFTVTFESNGGSSVTTITCNSYNSVITEPAEPTRNGYEFEGWYKEAALTKAWDFATDKVTGNITLYAKWNNVSGYSLHILTNIANDTWTDMNADSHNEGTEIKVTGVRLAEGTKFIPFKGDDWYHPNSTIEQYTFTTMVTIVSNGDSYEVTKVDENYANVLWTLYIKQDGTGISLEAPANAYENRNTQGTGKLTYSATGPNNTIYIAGTFTDGFKYHKDWSLESTAISILDERETASRVTFRGVYLKKNDAFKIVYNGVWYGGDMGNPTNGISTKPDAEGASAPNMILVSIEDGFYNIVFSTGSTHWCRLEEYVPVTIASVTVTPPTKKTYLVGEAFSSAGMVVTITDTDGNTHNEEYEIIGADTSTAGTKTVTVKYTGNLGGDEANKKATFTITVNKITVTYDSKGGSTVAANTTATYNSTITAPTAPTKGGYTFAGWYKESACQNLWDFATDKVTGNITLYAKWLREVTPGTYLHILTDFTAEVEDDKWSDLYSPVSHNNDTEWKVDGVKLQQGTKFLVVTYVANGEHTWYGANLPEGEDQIKQWTYNGVISIVKEGGDFKVDSINVGYVDVAWTLYIKKDGTAISLDVPVNPTTNRNPSNTGALTYGEAAPAQAIYIAGNFTDDFKYHKDWSNASTAITVKDEPSQSRVTFRGVYLKKNDTFKIVDKGAWYGGDLDLTGAGFRLSTDSRNLVAVMLDDGFYDIVYNYGNHFIRIEPYAPPTIASVTVTAPTKTTYFVGETFSTAGMVVTITDTDGKTHNTEYTMTDTSAITASAGTKTVTITYNGSLGGDAANKKATFTVTVSNITVTYDSQGGSAVSKNTTVTYNSTITKPADPTRAGYTFGGWYKEAACTNAWTFGASGDKVTSNITLYAKWTIITYNITYVVSDTTLGAAPANSTYTVEQAVTLPNPTNIKSGYTFIGWYTTSGLTGSAVSSIAKGSTGDKTFYAKIAQVVTVNLVFNYNYTGAPTATTVKVVSGEAGSALSPAPTRDGYTFGGWYTTSACSTAYTFPAMTANTTVYAKWTPIAHTVTYYVDGSVSNTAGNPTSYTIESGTVTLKNPTKTGYTFDGWYTSATYTGTKVTSLTYSGLFAGTNTAKSVPLYGRFTIDKYTVTFNSQSGSAVAAINNVTYNTTITKPADPTRAGYKFGGWYKEAACTNEWVFGTNGTKVTGNTTLYAKWTAIVKPAGSVAVGDDTVYLVGKFGNSDVTEEYGFKMTEDSSTQHSITKKLEVGDMFAGWHKGWDMWVTAIENSDMGSKFKEVTVDGRTYLQVQAGAAGTYTLYCKHVNGGANQFWISGPEIQLDANSAAFKFKDTTIVIKLGYLPSWGTPGSAFAYFEGTAWDSRHALDGKTTYYDYADKNLNEVSIMVGFMEGTSGKNTVAISGTAFTAGKVNIVTSLNDAGTDVKWTADWNLDYVITTAEIN